MDAFTREVVEVDVLFVGGGPASLSGAITLRRLAREAGRELAILVIEKAAAFGDHSLSGAILKTRSLDELFPAWRDDPTLPLDAPVGDERLLFLTRTKALRIPALPTALSNHDHRLVSLNRFVAWLAERAEAEGVDCLPAFPGQELLWAGDRVVGVRVGDKGLDRDGNPGPSFEPGPEIRAQVTILGEGVRGSLAKTAIAKLDLARDRELQVYALGIKELWRCPQERLAAGTVIHTLGYPLSTETFGGGWLYALNDGVLDLGLVVGLDAPDPTTDAHDAFNRFKLHPRIRPLLEGATLLRYGAKAIPEGGLYALPRLVAAGLLLIGDTAGTVDGLRLKGIHLAMKSGMLAAEAAFSALAAGRCDAEILGNYERGFDTSWAFEELYAARNVHRGFARGLFAGLSNVALGLVTRGRGFGIVERLAGKRVTSVRRLSQRRPRAESARVKPDGRLTFSKLDDVFHSGTHHDERQPGHLHVSDTTICAERCTSEYGNPCRHFCPAQVYHPEFAESESGVTGRLRIEFANCVHCKTCDIVDPYQLITWVPPQGGDGPVYTGM